MKSGVLRPFGKLILIVLCAVSLLPITASADGWRFHLGLAGFPKQNTLLGAEIDRVFTFGELEWSLGPLIRSDFSTTLGPGGASRIKYWFAESFAIGGVAELGYLLHQSTSSPSSYFYFLLGPLVAAHLKPVFIQWEPSLLFYQGASVVVPLRLSFGFVY